MSRSGRRARCTASARPSPRCQTASACRRRRTRASGCPETRTGSRRPRCRQIGRVTPVSSERSQSRDCCSAVATYASVRPSGDRSNDSGDALGGVVISTRVSAATGTVRRAGEATNAANATDSDAATASQIMRSRRRDAAGATPGGGLSRATSASASRSSSPGVADVAQPRFSDPSRRQRRSSRRIGRRHGGSASQSGSAR